jgi:hypothetical protein
MERNHIYREVIDMARSEALKKAQDKYSQKVKQVILKFNTETEADLLEHLQKQDRIQTYIKMLIKQDMEKEEQK